MRHKAIMFGALLAIPFAAAAAQRGGRGGAAAGGTGSESGAPRFQRPATAGQVEDLNPARMLLDRRKKLSLADSQVAQMEALEQAIAQRNKDLITQYDSVRGKMRFPNAAPAAGAMGATMGNGARGRGASGASGGSAYGGSGSTQSEEAMALLRSQMMVLQAIGLQLRERRPADLAEALALLTPDQAGKAAEFVTEQNEEFDRILPAGARRG